MYTKLLSMCNSFNNEFCSSHISFDGKQTLLCLPYGTQLIFIRLDDKRYLSILNEIEKCKSKFLQNPKLLDENNKQTKIETKTNNFATQ